MMALNPAQHTLPIQVSANQIETEVILFAMLN
jgi:hypothetical protein